MYVPSFAQEQSGITLVKQMFSLKKILLVDKFTRFKEYSSWTFDWSMESAQMKALYAGHNIFLLWVNKILKCLLINICFDLLIIIDSQIVEYVTANVYAVYDIASNDLVNGRKFLTSAELLLFWHSGSQSQTPANVLTSELTVIIRSVIVSDGGEDLCSGGSAFGCGVSIRWSILTPENQLVETPIVELSRL